MAEIVAAKSRTGLKAALAQLDGALSRSVRELRESLTDALAESILVRLTGSSTSSAESSLASSSAISRARQELEGLAQAGQLGRLACKCLRSCH